MAARRHDILRIVEIHILPSKIVKFLACQELTSGSEVSCQYKCATPLPHCFHHSHERKHPVGMEAGG
jgi:hypothetical protein